MYESKQPLLDRRVPLTEIVEGRAYLIHARNGGIGIAERNRHGGMSYVLARTKFHETFLDDEDDWDAGAPHGTAIPLRLLPELPPVSGKSYWNFTREEEAATLQWLAAREKEHEAETQEDWESVLGPLTR